MQDKYVGDVGDFGKYLLLKKIIESARLLDENIRLGINWYYVKYEKGKDSDGRHIDYLLSTNKKSLEYKDCDLDLYRELGRLVGKGNRSIRKIQERIILPAGTVYYSDPLDKEDGRPVDREDWFKKSLDALGDADIILLDPDNGIQTDSVKKTNKGSVKYVFRDEVKRYFEEGKTLIVYNHRDYSSYEKYREKIVSIKPHGLEKDYFRVLRFRRVSVRHYVFLIQDRHVDLIGQVIKELTSESCSFLFGYYPVD